MIMVVLNLFIGMG